jgi:hypothetical protein
LVVFFDHLKTLPALSEPEKGGIVELDLLGWLGRKGSNLKIPVFTEFHPLPLITIFLLQINTL